MAGVMALSVASGACRVSTVNAADGRIVLTDTEPGTTEELRQKLSDAMEKSAAQTQIGCVAPIGGTEDYSVMIYEDAHVDKEDNMMHEILTHVIFDTKEDLYRLESYYDDNEGVFFMDDGSGKYKFAFGTSEDSKLEYLSMDFYLEYIPKRCEITSGGKRNVTTPDGSTVETEVLLVKTEYPAKLLPFDSASDKQLVLSDPASNDYVSSDNALAYTGTVSGDEVFTVTNEYTIGSDGLLYTAGRIAENGEVNPLSLRQFYYPGKNVEIPSKMLKKSVLAEGAWVNSGELIFTAYYKNGKPHFGVADYYEETPVDVTVPSKLEVRGKTYKVDRVLALAFYEMTDLKTITLPKSVSMIEEDAFASCESLEKVFVKNKKLRKKLLKSRSYRDKVGIDKNNMIYG